jgi:hypothetical protein
VLGRPLLFLPLLAILFGVIALRPSIFGVPVGTIPAKLGVFLAVFFGALGISLPMANNRTLGGQAEYFGRQFIELVKAGEWEMTAELQKSYVNRFLPTMSLGDYYETNQQASESLREMREGGAYEEIYRTGSQTDWRMVSSRVFTRWGHQMVETNWVDQSGTNSQQLDMEMEYLIDKHKDIGHWHVTLFQFHRERLVAESVL